MVNKKKELPSNALYLAIKASLQAGEVIMDVYNRAETVEELEVVEKADGSPITKVDNAANDVILAVLAETSLPILSEEGKEEPYKKRAKWSMYWLIDPLDGTKDFIKRNGEFTVNVALIADNQPVLGVVYAPFKKTLYFANQKEGAFKSMGVTLANFTDLDELLKTSTRLPLAFSRQGIVVVTSRSRQNDAMTTYLDSLKKKGMPVTMMSSGSSEKICLVAEGVADLYPRFTPCMEWDTAAAHAIAKEAGCEIYCWKDKKPLMYNKEDLMNPWFVVKPVSTKKLEL